MAISPSPFAAVMATPVTRAPTSRPGTPCAPWRGGQTSSTSPTPSCARARTWIISIALAGAWSLYCHAVAWRTKSFASGCKPYPRVDLRLGSTSSALCRWTARSLVRLFGAIAIGGRLDRRLDLEHAAYPAPGGEATTERGCGQRTARRITPAARRAKNEVAASSRYRFPDQDNPREDHVVRYIKVERTVREGHIYKQSRPGRPGPATAFRKITRRRFDIEWRIDQDAIAYDHKSDGMYPLITNDRNLSPAQVLEAHKGQPMIEKRFEQIKSVHEIAPVLLNNEGRIEALFTLYFLALLVQAIIERELRLAMKRDKISELPLYPEQRSCSRPLSGAARPSH